MYHKQMHRVRTLSDEGVKMFLDGVVGQPTKKTLKKLLFSCFHSDYDDRLSDVVMACREATKALFVKLLKEKNVNKRLDAGISHATRLVLTADVERVQKSHIRRNFRFFLDVMEHAFATNDHQTAMLMYLSLTHSSIARIDFKRPKKTKGMFNKMDERYGDCKTCYARHIEEIIERWASDDYLPSVIAIALFTGKYNNYRSTNPKVPNMLENLQSVVELYGMLNFREEYMIPLYNQEQLNSTELFNLSEAIQQNKNRKWKYNPTFGKDCSTNKYVHK
jgi:hypothetical protein